MIAFVGLVSRFLALVFFFFCLVVYTSTSQTQSLYSIRSTETDRQTTLYRRPDTDQLWSQSTAGSYRLQGIDRIHVQGGGSLHGTTYKDVDIPLNRSFTLFDRIVRPCSKWRESVSRRILFSGSGIGKCTEAYGVNKGARLHRTG